MPVHGGHGRSPLVAVAGGAAASSSFSFPLTPGAPNAPARAARAFPASAHCACAERGKVTRDALRTRGGRAPFPPTRRLFMREERGGASS